MHDQLHILYLNTSNAGARRDLASSYECHRTLSRATPASGRLLFWRDTTYKRLFVYADRPDFTALPIGYLSAVVQVPLSGLAGNRDWLLWANPTVTRDGRRHAVAAGDYPAWLRRKLCPETGFRVEFINGCRRMLSTEPQRGTTHVGCQFDFRATVLDEDLARQTMAAGVGPAKGFGFGLLIPFDLLLRCVRDKYATCA